ncbi:hypothetical protein HDU93_001175 [Gonapodya sp. JEL0774]|nr:hypothetical protein HDU93_001175 [Gonapodya sp. JEL0774]
MVSSSSSTGFVWAERYMWHDTGTAAGYLPAGGYFEPASHFESSASKRRFRNLVEVAGLLDNTLTTIKPREATIEEIKYYHTDEYITHVKKCSDLGFGDGGELTPIGKHSYEIALLSAGGCIEAVDQVLDGKLKNAYALNRPPGHHAEKDKGRGFCIFNNVVIAAEHCIRKRGLKKVAILDWGENPVSILTGRLNILHKLKLRIDVHHGNGTQKAFYGRKDVLFVSIHQDRFYPPDLGNVEENGEGEGLGYNINVPLPPGSGHGAYLDTIERLVIPAFYQFKPDIILVSSGFDAGFLDPLGRMMAYGETYRLMTRMVMKAAHDLCHDRVVMVHEGGYSPVYVPWCGLATVEELSGQKAPEDCVDIYGTAVFANVGGQDLQPHQKILIDSLVKEKLPLVK